MAKDFYDRADEMLKLSHMLESLKSVEFVLMYGNNKQNPRWLAKKYKEEF